MRFVGAIKEAFYALENPEDEELRKLEQDLGE